MVVAEEGWPVCSVASEISAVAMERAFDDLDAPILRVTNEAVPLPYAAKLEKAALLKADDVVEAVRKVCYRLGTASCTPGWWAVLPHGLRSEGWRGGKECGSKVKTQWWVE